MRVSESDLNIISQVFKNALPDVKVFLFGSRVDDEKRGGDLDLFVTTTKETVPIREKLTLLVQLERKGIERKVDLIIQTPTQPQEKIFTEVQDKGILLC